MKKRYRLPVVLIWLLAAYVIGAVLFASITTLPHIALAHTAQMNAAAEMAEAYAEGSLLEEDIGKHRKVMIYSDSGQLQAAFDPYSSIPYFCEDEAEAYFAADERVPKAKPMVVIESMRGSFADRVDIVIYAVQPISGGGEDAAVLVLIADLVSDVFFVQYSFWGFNCIFLCFLILAVIFSRKQRAMDSQKQNYIDNITHELKTPIASIKALTTALNDHDLDADTRSEYYGLILAAAGRQEHMVQNILELSRIQSRDISFKKSPARLDAVFQEICRRYSSLCDDLDIRWREPENLEQLPVVHTNADCVQRLLDILLGNALRYTDENGEIGLSVQDSGRHVTVCVSDSGNGIEPEELKHIFERFFRGSNSYLKGGNGLGLAIARELADGLGETIWAESKVGKGSKFYFTISKK